MALPAQMPGNDKFGIRALRQHLAEAFGPGLDVGIFEIAQVRAFLALDETSAIQDSVGREPHHDVVWRVAFARVNDAETVPAEFEHLVWPHDLVGLWVSEFLAERIRLFA